MTAVLHPCRQLCEFEFGFGFGYTGEVNQGRETTADAGAESLHAPMLPPATQSRSRESLDRVLDATIALLADRGTGDFTIAEVSTRAGVAVGTIYGRVGSKDALVLAVQERELDRIDRATIARLDAASRAGTDFAGAIGAIVEARVGILADEAGLLRALIRVAAGDDAVFGRGRSSGIAAQRRFTASLRHVCERFAVVVEADDIDWADELVFAVATRQLGIGLSDRASPTRVFDIHVLVQRLTATVASYLSTRAPQRNVLGREQ